MTTIVDADRAWDVVFGGRELAQAGLVSGTVGNVSVRDGTGMLITPTRTRYHHLDARDVVRVDLEATTPPPEASREWLMHTEVYRARPEVGAVVHTHSVHATAWSFLDEPLTPELEETAYYAIGPVRTAAHNPAASPELARGAAEALGSSKAVLLARHGVLACGASVVEAVDIARVIERHAQIAWLLRGHSPRNDSGAEK